MFQFPGFALKTLCIQVISTWLTQLLIPKGNNNRVSGGFPHSEIHGSKLILSSPWLIAEYHVLHRLLLPRHPPNALIALDLIRKKKDPASRRRGPSIPRPFACRGGRFRSKACTFPAFSIRKRLSARLPCSNHAFWLVYLTWTTSLLVWTTTAPPLGHGQ